MKYQWKRFWCSRTGIINLSDSGFLVDPESEYAKWTPSDVVPFEKIVNVPCLALLGEPGTGKSTTMEDLQTELEESLQSSNDQILYLNLNEYGDESRLIGDLFESEKFTNWRSGAHVLHILLDSLDECKIRIPQVATILIKRFNQIHSQISRLKIRIACRTFDWPVTLERLLPELFGENNFGAYELSPLRRKDVQTAIEAEGINSEQFFTELSRTESVPLAIKPITLDFLMSVFKSQGRFPNTRLELYEVGCRLLCEELSSSRLDLRLEGGAGQLSADQRLTIASRIAAVSIFCRKPTIFNGPSTETLIKEEMPVSKLSCGNEISASAVLEISEDHVREALRTGLFSSRGAHRMGFAHQTYAEFLASRYLDLKGIPFEKVLSILQHPNDPEKHIVPQLYETAAWASSRNKDVLNAISKNDPQILLRSDEGTLTDEDREEIIDSLLEALHIRVSSALDLDLSRYYVKLKYAGLADQLRIWITDTRKHFSARDTAIDIIEVCEVKQLQSRLVILARDYSEIDRIRINATRTVAKIGDAGTRKCLRPPCT